MEGKRTSTEHPLSKKKPHKQDLRLFHCELSKVAWLPLILSTLRLQLNPSVTRAGASQNTGRPREGSNPGPAIRLPKTGRWTCPGNAGSYADSPASYATLATCTNTRHTRSSNGKSGYGRRRSTETTPKSSGIPIATTTVQQRRRR